MTERQAKEAIEARLKGEWDNPYLVLLGPLMVDAEEDVKRIRAMVKPEAGNQEALGW